MIETVYKPEGYYVEERTPSLSLLEKAKNTRQILEARATQCDVDHNLIVDLGTIKGIIPREETAIGVKDGTVRDVAVLSRVNKQICFKVNDLIKHRGQTIAELSRLSAQEEALNYMINTYRVGDVVDARITHLEPFGAFADIGCGIIGLISIENISVSRINHPRDRFIIGQRIKAIIKSIDYEKRRFTLSHKELLGTWSENVSVFKVGQTVCGTIRSVESYGVFVELSPNLVGLAEVCDDVCCGEKASVYIKSILPEKMKIKLAIVDHYKEKETPDDLKYYVNSNHIDSFIYSPAESDKRIETVF